MERAFHRNHLLLAVEERSQFQCVFIRLGSRVTQEQLVIAFARQAAEFFGQLLLLRNDYGIGIKSYIFQLIGHHLHIMRMGVADRDHGVSAVEVEVFRAGRIIDETAPAAYRFDGVEGIYVEKFHVFPFVFRRRGGLGFRMRRL